VDAVEVHRGHADAVRAAVTGTAGQTGVSLRAGVLARVSCSVV
jgi:hypothetical protein